MGDTSTKTTCGFAYGAPRSVYLTHRYEVISVSVYADLHANISIELHRRPPILLLSEINLTFTPWTSSYGLDEHIQ